MVALFFYPRIWEMARDPCDPGSVGYSHAAFPYIDGNHTHSFLGDRGIETFQAPDDRISKN